MQSKKDRLPPELEALAQVVEGIARTFGRNCEVVLHDLRDPERSLTVISGTVTGRQPGAPVTDLVLQTLRKYGNDAKDIIGYKNRTRDGRLLKSSTIFVRNRRGRISGCLCLNYDITLLQTAAGVIEDLCSTEDERKDRERFVRDIEEMLQTVVEETAVELGKTAPPGSRHENLEMVRALDQKGLFLVRGAVNYVAHYLGVSKYTVYSYLAEIRNEVESV